MIIKFVKCILLCGFELGALHTNWQSSTYKKHKHQQTPMLHNLDLSELVFCTQWQQLKITRFYGFPFPFFFCRKNGDNSCIRIIHHKGQYGLPHSDLNFPSLSKFVEYYRNHSFASFNKHLDICLQDPVFKVSTWNKQEWSYSWVFDFLIHYIILNSLPILFLLWLHVLREYVGGRVLKWQNIVCTMMFRNVQSARCKIQNF